MNLPSDQIRPDLTQLRPGFLRPDPTRPDPTRPDPTRTDLKRLETMFGLATLPIAKQLYANDAVIRGFS